MKKLGRRWNDKNLPDISRVFISVSNFFFYKNLLPNILMVCKTYYIYEFHLKLD